MLTIESIITIILGYLFGSISSAIITCKLLNLPDPRTEGSHNPGATNVLRIGGKKAAAITLLGDMLKGVIPVLIAKYLTLTPNAIGLVAFAAFIGHLYPIFFRFEGGKGVATAIGCIFALSFPAGICWFMTWFLIALIFRYSSLAALITSLVAPLYILFFTHQTAYTISIAVMSLLLIYRHRSNIRKLMNGTEDKIGEK
jgi:glycerol-3-phosphate acyltransferase PlsY